MARVVAILQHVDSFFPLIRAGKPGGGWLLAEMVQAGRHPLPAEFRDRNISSCGFEPHPFPVLQRQENGDLFLK